MRPMLIVLLALSAGCACVCPDRAQPRRASTIAHEILMLETGVIAQPVALERLDTFLGVCEKRIARRDAYMPEEARAALREIGAIIREQGYAYSGAEVTLLGEALAHKKVDCDTAAYLYLAAGEIIGLPLAGVLAPGHFFVRWQGEHCALDWETTTNLESYDNDYAVTFSIHPDAIANGVYLKSLRRKDVLALSAALVAQVFAWRKQYDDAIQCFSAAIEKFPALALAYTNRARCYREKLDPARAHADLDRALVLDPANSHAYAFRSVVCMDEGRLDNAIDAISTAICLRPVDPALYAFRSELYKSRSAQTNSLEDLCKASEDAELAQALASPRPSLLLSR